MEEGQCWSQKLGGCQVSDQEWALCQEPPGTRPPGEGPLAEKRCFQRPGAGGTLESSVPVRLSLSDCWWSVCLCN